MQNNVDNFDQIPDETSVGQQQTNGDNSESQDNSKNQQEVPDLSPNTHSEPIKAGDDQVPEVDEEHVHETDPVISESDFEGTGKGTQNTGTSGF